MAPLRGEPVVAGVFELPALEPLPEVVDTDAAAAAAAAEREETTVAELEAAIAAAHAEADAIREAARAEGHAAGLEEARPQVAAAAAALAAALHGVEDERAAIAGRAEVAAVELAFAIAEQMLGAALDVQPERVVDVVRGALRRLVERERVTVLVHPEDLDLVRASASELVAELGGIEHCEVQAERRVARGGAVVRTAEGEVDATLATKLELVRAAVTEAMAGDDAEEPAAAAAVAPAAPADVTGDVFPDAEIVDAQLAGEDDA